MENGIQNKIRDIRIFSHAFWINKCFKNHVKMVNKILQSYLDRFAITYINDILIYSDNKN